MIGQPPFRYTIAPLRGDVVDIHYVGYMNADAKQHVAELDALFGAAPRPLRLCFTAGDLVGFHRDQLRAHVELFARNSSHIHAIAIVKARPVVHFGSVTLALMTKLPIRNFESQEDAHRWLDSLEDQGQPAPAR